MNRRQRRAAQAQARRQHRSSDVLAQAELDGPHAIGPGEPVIPPELDNVDAFDLAHGILSPELYRTCAQAVTNPFKSLDLSVRHDLSALVGALGRNDYSFVPPGPEATFPVIARRQDAEGYAPQFVDDVRALLSSGEFVAFPVIVHLSSIDEFSKGQNFVHEVLHVMQRVRRKHRVPIYAYQDAAGALRVRNPTSYVHVSVEDEIEVQQILGRSGYSVSTRPIMYHVQANLRRAFSDTSPVEATRVILEGISGIRFEKYRDVLGSDLRDALLDEVAKVWPGSRATPL